MDRFLSIEDLEALPPPKWMIEGLFEQDALVMLVGPPGSFKSFLAIDWALCLALGHPWNARRTTPSRVLYMLGEGKASLLKRIKAWQDHHGLTQGERQILNANFRVTFEVPQLANTHEASDFMSELDEDGFNPTLIIVDTLARSFVGKNENDSMDVGLWVEHADKLRQRGATVLILHHTKKNVEFGLTYRGNTAWQGALDTGFVLERNSEGRRGTAKLSCSKQKDHEDPVDIWMRPLHIRPAQAVEGSIVLVEIDAPDGGEKDEREAADNALQLIVDSLMDDPTFPSDRARARELAKKANMLEGTAQTRIYRARKQQPTIEKDINAEQELS